MLQKELAKRLKAWYDTKMDGNGWLEVSSDGIPLCRIKYNGQFLSNADKNLSDEYRSKIADLGTEVYPQIIEQATYEKIQKTTQIVLFYEDFYKTKRDTTIAKQLLRSATSIGANINEAVYGNSKADFISKMHIALKETGESIYWLALLKRTNLIEYKFDELLLLAEEIKRMLIASLNTAKKNQQDS